MLKKTVTYVNYDGEEVTETLYFNLNQLEVTKIQAKYAKNGEDLEAYAERITEAKDLETMIEFVETLVLSSYGEKSEDGKRFVKTKEIRENFEYSLAYAELMAVLLTNPQEAKEFGGSLITVRNSKPMPLPTAAKGE